VALREKREKRKGGMGGDVGAFIGEFS
jgi:hypothetical protein